jgi:hypothetical protein
VKPTVRAHLKPGMGVIEMDGTPLTGVRRAVIEAEVGHVPTLTVELSLQEAEINGEMVIAIPPGTAATLIGLGWTPPTGQLVDSPEQPHAWRHACDTLNEGSPEDSGCCSGCRQEPNRYDLDTSPRYVLVQVRRPADAPPG